MRPLAAFLALFAGACCTSLPRLPAKSTSLPRIEPQFDAVTESTADWRDEERKRDVPVRIYAPAGAQGKLPVIVFSHGIGEDRDSYAWLGRALARFGYLTVHVTHAGTDRAVLERGYRHLYRAVKQKENWVNRPLDVSFVLDRLAGRADVDVTRTAVIGHSAGAFTAFAVAGMRTAGGETLRDERVRVVIPMSMPRLDGVVSDYDVAIPVLNLTGTCDTSIIYRTFPRHRRIPFESSHGQFLVTIDRANHDSFVLDDPRHPQILTVIVAFLRAWMDGDGAARAWFEESGTTGIGGVRLAVEHDGTTTAK